MIKRLLLTAVLLTLVLAPGAAADVRYASPAGAGTVCSLYATCNITQAINGASANDDIFVLDGEYSLAATLTPSVPLRIFGPAPWRGTAKPHIFATGVPVLESFQPLQLIDLSLDSTDADSGNGATVSLLGTGSSAERVGIKEVSSTSAEALRTGSNFTIRNSVLRASGQTDATALFFQATAPDTWVSVRNVTAIASAPTSSTGIGIFGTAGGQNTKISAYNVIADAGIDVTAGAAPGISAGINLVHSNFNSSSTTGAGAAYVTSAGGQSAPPAFNSAAVGDFHQAPGSVTIDAGLTDVTNGSIDLDGNPRIAGKAIDIGAFEFQPVTSPDTKPPRTTIGALRLGRDGRVRFTLQCPTDELSCRWSYSLRSAHRLALSKKRPRLRRRIVRLGKGSVPTTFDAKRVTASLKLSRKNVRLIKRRGRLRVRLTVNTTDGSGNKASRSKAGTLKAPKKRAKRR
jgi:hypothetical protein